MLKNSTDAEDVAQEVFIEVYRSVHRFKGDSTLATWIYRITINKCLEKIRHSKRKKRAAQTRSVDETPWNEPADFNHPGVVLENRERARILFSAIEKLPDNQKTAFILHKTEGLSYKEISAVMKSSVSSVESLMFRAKQNLQKYLREYYES